MTQKKQEEKRKTLKIKAKSKKCLDIVMCTIEITKTTELADTFDPTIKKENIKHLRRNKGLEYHDEDNTVTITTGENVSPLGPVCKYYEEINDDKNKYIVTENDKKKVNLKKLIRYTISQLLPSKAKTDKGIDDLEALGFKLKEPLTPTPLSSTEMEDLVGDNEKKKNKVVEKLLKEGFDQHYADGQEVVMKFKLSDQGIIDCRPISRGNVTVPKETYISNVLADNDGRSDNLKAASEIYASSKNKPDGKSKYTRQEVDNWMKEHGYTWHEIDDEANMQKIPTHVHECIRHAGAVSLVIKKDERNLYHPNTHKTVINKACEKASKTCERKDRNVERAENAFKEAKKSNDQKKIEEARDKLATAKTNRKEAYAQLEKLQEKQYELNNNYDYKRPVINKLTK